MARRRSCTRAKKLGGWVVSQRRLH
jgi:hypothetical protein